MKFPAGPRIWPTLTLPGQFLLAGAAVMVVGMLIVGGWVATTIRAAVVQNSALTSAQFVENFISPIGQDLGLADRLSEPAQQALQEIFSQTPLSDRVVSYKFWLPDGTVAHASNPDIIGQTFEIGDDLRAALSGGVHASYEYPDAEENTAEAEFGLPLLEVYMPLRQEWTNDVIAAVEFYEVNPTLVAELSRARLASWGIVGLTFVTSGVLLFGIVQAGGRKIRDQSEQLRQQLKLTQRISDQNAELQRRAVTASARATAKSERMMRQLGSDLHDGPAQYLSLAALRLDEVVPDTEGGASAKLDIRKSLDSALEEIRLLSRGLLLPDLDDQNLATVITRAVDAHRRRTQADISMQIDGDTGVVLGYAQKLCVYRFLQETLSNAARHAPQAAISVVCTIGDTHLTLTLSDDGPGFDLAEAIRLRPQGGQGLLGLRDRVESIGGDFETTSSPGAGAAIRLTLPFERQGTT